MAIAYSSEHLEEMARAEKRESGETLDFYLEFYSPEEKNVAISKLELNSEIFNVDENISDYRNDRNNDLVLRVSVMNSSPDEAEKLARALGAYRVTRDFKPLYSRVI